MRKIEKEMNTAVRDHQNWSKANTTVYIMPDSLRARIHLHGHHIATVSTSGSVEVNLETLANWPTNTTKSRLRALGVPVVTRKGRVYVNDVDILTYGYRHMVVDYNDTRYYG